MREELKNLKTSDLKEYWKILKSTKISQSFLTDAFILSLVIFSLIEFVSSL
jgi:hypothetical protein